MPGTDEPLPGLNDLRVADPHALREALESGLDRDPDRRPATARDLASGIATGLLGAGASSAGPADERSTARGQRRTRSRAPRLPGLEDPLTAKPIEPAPEEAALVSSPAEDFDIERPADEPAVSDVFTEPPPLDTEGSQPEFLAGASPLDFGSLVLQPPSTASQPLATPDFSALERDLRSPSSAEHASRAEMAIDDLRLPGTLVSAPPVPRAIDPGSPMDPSFRRPEQPRRGEGWGFPALAAVLVVGISIGLLGGYQLGIRRTTPASAVRAPEQGVGSSPSAAPTTAPPASAPRTGATPSSASPSGAPPAASPTTPAVSATAAGSSKTSSLKKAGQGTVPGVASGDSARPAASRKAEARAPATPPAARAVPPALQEEPPATRRADAAKKATPRPRAAKPVASTPASAKAQKAAAAPAADQGATVAASFQFDSRPAGARIVLDGLDIGRTPFTLPAVSAGRHTVRFELDGFAPWTATVTAVAGQRARVTASLERGPSR